MTGIEQVFTIELTEKEVEKLRDIFNESHANFNDVLAVGSKIRKQVEEQKVKEEEDE